MVRKPIKRLSIVLFLKFHRVLFLNVYNRSKTVFTAIIFPYIFHTLYGVRTSILIFYLLRHSQIKHNKRFLERCVITIECQTAHLPCTFHTILTIFDCIGKNAPWPTVRSFQRVDNIYRTRRCTLYLVYKAQYPNRRWWKNCYKYIFYSFDIGVREMFLAQWRVICKTKFHEYVLGPSGWRENDIVTFCIHFNILLLFEFAFK